MWISIEGNIGSGKTTVFEALKKKQPEQTFAPEPVDSWLVPQECLQGKSMLEMYYSNPEKQGPFFQTQALSTRLAILKQLETRIQSPSELVISERTPETDFNVFAPMVSMTDFERACQNSIQESLFDLKKHLHGIIYLQASPSVCLDRVHQRGRNSETSITKDYLEKVHKHHEQWLQRQSSVRVVSTDHSSPEEVLSFVEGAIQDLQLQNARAQ